MKQENVDIVQEDQGVMDLLKPPLESSSKLEKEPAQKIPRENVPKQNKDALPREIIEAKSAFSTIKSYCKNLIRASNNKASTKYDHRKNNMILNFFAKPVVDRPISIP